MSLRLASGHAPQQPALADTAPIKQALQDGRERIRQRYFEDRRAPRVLVGHCRLIDVTLRALWQQAHMPRSTALVAVGGYGRGEVYPYSDIDLLILLSTSADAELRGKIETLVGVLWDLGLAVGHSARPVAGCEELGALDGTVQTSLLEARLLSGSHTLYGQFSAVVRKAVNPQLFYKAKQLEQQQRHERFQDTNLEPNIKESAGGLRTT